MRLSHRTHQPAPEVMLNELGERPDALDSQAGLSRMGGVAAVAGLAVVGALAVSIVGERFGIGSGPIDVKEEAEVDEDSLQAEVITIDPINFGCFAEVTSRVETEIKYRHRVSVIVGTKTTDTSTLRLEDYKGDTDLCVNNDETEISDVITFDNGERKKVVIEVGAIEARRPRIDHDGNGRIVRELSAAERARQAADPNRLQALEEGLYLIAQHQIGTQSCVEEGLDVARDQVIGEYEKLGRSLGIDEVEVIFKEVAEAGEAVEGENVTDELRDQGISIPDDVDVRLAGPVCEATLIDGDPAVSGE